MKLALPTRKSAAPEAELDLSASIARATRNPAQRAKPVEVTVPAVEVETLAILDAAVKALHQASGAVRDAAGHVIAAAAEQDPARRALLAEKYDDARQRIDQAATEASDDAKTLLMPGATNLSFPVTGAVYAIAPFPLATEEAGLDLPPPSDGFATHTEVAATLRQVETALERVSSAIDVYERDAAFIRSRHRSVRDGEPGRGIR